MRQTVSAIEMGPRLITMFSMDRSGLELALMLLILMFNIQMLFAW